MTIPFASHSYDWIPKGGFWFCRTLLLYCLLTNFDGCKIESFVDLSSRARFSVLTLPETNLGARAESLLSVLKGWGPVLGDSIAPEVSSLLSTN